MEKFLLLFVNDRNFHFQDARLSTSLDNKNNERFWSHLDILWCKVQLYIFQLL